MSSPENSQQNSVGNGNLYAVQRGNINIGGPKPGLRLDSKVLLVFLVVDVASFFYGTLAYTGEGTTGDNWRAISSLFLFALTLAMIGRWIRRRV